MENLESYFINQEEEISNIYLDANGTNEPQNDRQTNIEYIKEHSSTIILYVVVVAALIYGFKYIGIKAQIGD